MSPLLVASASRKSLALKPELLAVAIASLAKLGKTSVRNTVCRRKRSVSSPSKLRPSSSKLYKFGFSFTQIFVALRINRCFCDSETIAVSPNPNPDSSR